MILRPRGPNDAEGSEPVWLPTVPWPLPSAIGLATGIAARNQEVPAWALLVLLPLVPVSRRLLLRARAVARGHKTGGTPIPAAAWPPTGSPPLPLRSLLTILLPLIALAVGYWRYGTWLDRPDPLAGLRDKEIRLTGVSDGRVIRLREPRIARLVLSPSGSVPAGYAELRGTVRDARTSRNPGGFDYRGYLSRRGVDGLLHVDEVLLTRPSVLLRDRLRRGVTSGLPPPSAALLEAMTLGVRDELGELRATFAAAGLAHVLALSGLHVGLLMTAAGWLLSPLGTVRYPLLLALAGGYVLLTGGGPSVVRAGIMVGVVLLGLWLGAGRVEPWPALGLAALVTLVVHPAWLFDLSLQLSYAAVAGILLFGLPLASLLGAGPGLPPWHPRVFLLGSMLVSAGAQALTLPLVAGAFGTLPLLSPLVNVVGLPLAAALVPLGFAAALLGLLSPALAAAANIVTALPAFALIRLAELGARMPSVTWGEIELVGYVYFAAGAGALALAVARLLRPRRALLLVLLATLLSAATPPERGPPELVALDVGQGDSLLLRLPGRVEVLVDGGGTPFSSYDVGAGAVLPALRALGADELELVVASHADADHIEGLASVVRGIPVQMILIGHAEPERAVFSALMEAARERGVPVRSLNRGERVSLAGAELEVLNPPFRSYGSSNDDSLALAVSIAGVPRALLLGDISERVEADLVPPEVDVLVAPHHGSPSSSSSRLLNLARPRHAVISVGVNRYGHPAPEVLERFRRVGAEVHLTREEGAVRLPLGP